MNTKTELDPHAGTAFLVLGIGGSAVEPLNTVMEHAIATNIEDRVHVLFLDTDQDPKPRVHADLRLSIHPPEAIVAEPTAFGEIPRRIFEQDHEFLMDSNAQACGARTKRSCMQFALRCQERSVGDFLGEGYRALAKKAGPGKRFQFLIVCSTGGGSGSAGGVEIPRMLVESAQFQSRTSAGERAPLPAPILFAIDPWPRILQNVNQQSPRIKTNCIAVRDDIVALEERYPRMYSWIYRFARLSDHPEANGRHVGIAMASCIASFDQLAGRAADGFFGRIHAQGMRHSS